MRSGCQQPPLDIGRLQGTLHSVATAMGAATTEARSGQEAGGAEFPQGLFFAPGMVTVPFRSHQKASSFRIILLLVSVRTGHGPIRNAQSARAPRLPRSIIAWLLVHRFDEIDHMGGIHFCWDDL